MKLERTPHDIARPLMLHNKCHESSKEQTSTCFLSALYIFSQFSDQCEEIREMNQTPLLRIGIVRTLANISQEEAIDCFDKLPNSPCDRPGFEVEIFDTVMKLLKWNYTWVIADELGSVEDGLATGLIGMVDRGEVDIGASTMRFLPERLEMINFAYPIWYYKQTFTIAKPQAHSFRHFAFTPFDPIVWLLLAIFILLCVLVDWTTHCLLILRNRKMKRKAFAVIVSLQNYIGMLLRQDVNLPRFASFTSMASFYAFFCLIVTNYYESIMTGMLTVPLNPHVPFRNIEQLTGLLEKKEKSLVYFYAGYEPTYPEALRERFEASLVVNPIKVSQSYPVVLDMIKHGAVYFGSEYDDKIPFRVSNSDRKDNFITIRDDSIAATFGSFMFPKNSTYLMRFNSALISILPGVNRIKSRYKGQKPFPNAEHSAPVETSTLTLEYLWELFTVWAIGMCLAVVCCLLELYGWRQKKKRIMIRMKNDVGMLFTQFKRFADSS